MKFTLHYRGSLRSNGDRNHKQKLRSSFHPQLSDLWSRNPLVGQKDHFLNPSYELSAIEEVQGFEFASVVNSRNHLVAKLDIVLLRPEDPGNVLAQGGDIDNRLKTLFDALSVPKDGQLPKGFGPDQDEQPFHCLLEDDSLVTGVSVRSDRLLGGTTPHEVLLLIQVDVSATRGTFENLSFSL